MFDDPPAPVIGLLDVSQITVLVEDAGQLADLPVQTQVSQADLGVVQAPLPAQFEQLGDVVAVGSAQVAEQFIGEIAVSLGKELLGRRSQFVDVRGAPTALRLLTVDNQPVLSEAIELLANCRDGDAELLDQIPRSQSTVAFEGGQNRPPG